MADTSKQSRTFLSETKWKPRNNMMLLKPTVEDEVTEGGIIRPDSYRKKMSSGFICVKGPNVDADLWVGDEVFFEPHQEYRIVLDDIDEEAVLISDSHVLLSMRPASVPHPPLEVDINDAFNEPVSKARVHWPRKASESDEEYNGRMLGQEDKFWRWDVDTQQFARR